VPDRIREELTGFPPPGKFEYRKLKPGCFASVLLIVDSSDFGIRISVFPRGGLMRLSIRYQLLLPMLALMLGVVGMSTWTAWSSAQRARRQIEAQLDAVAATVNAVTFPRNPQTLNLMKGLSGADFLLCDESRRPLTDDQGRPVSTLPAAPDELPAAEGPGEGPGTPVRVGATPYIARGVRLEHGGPPGLWLYVFYPEALWRDALWQAVRPALFVGVLGGLASVALAVAVTQRVARRIQELERRTRLIAAGDFSPMPLPRRDDELRDLGRSVNEMAQQLARYQETVRRTERLRLLGQVSGGLAHQLRNGVAGARLAVQLHGRECRADAETLAVALRQLVLVETHLKRFLDLGKTPELHREPCELGRLLDEAADLLGPQCRHAHIELRRERDPEAGPLPLFADPGQLGQLLLNVLTNAVEAAGPGGHVELRLGQAGPGRAFVEVYDSGPGPPSGVAARLFEPFVTGKAEGVGLGLAVARQVAEAHGGTIIWQRRGDRTVFRIELPLAEPPVA
jgi:signal transduction histidine kinase